MKKLVVYVHSFEIPTIGFVDKEGAMHACAQAQKTAFQGLERVTSNIGSRYLPDDERETLMMLDNFCENEGLELEVVDLGTASFLTRLKMSMKGLKTPAICCGESHFMEFQARKNSKSF